ncbi:MAG: trigger factor [Rhodospirillales bacterium]
MQVTATKDEGLSREYKVVVPAETINSRMDSRLEELAGTVRLPGFRPGKAPVALLRKRFGASLMGEILEAAVNETSSQALSDNGIRPAQQPKIEITSFEDGKDLEYTISVEVLPVIEPMDFSTLKLERLVVAVPEEDVEKALENIAGQHKTLTTDASGRAAAEGDTVVIDFLGKIDGEPFEGGAAEGYGLELGSGSFIPGFEEQLIGAKAGDQMDVKVTFPEAYGAEHLAGKDAVFECKIHEIQTGEAAALDDELAQKMGATDLEDLKAKIRDSHAGEYKQIARMRLKRELLDRLAENHSFDLPPAMLETEIDGVKKQLEAQPAEDGDEGKSDEEKAEEYREIAERRVRLGLLLAEVGHRNNLQIGQDEVSKALMAEARKYPGNEQQVIEFFQKNPQMLQQLTGPLYEDKVIDFIVEMAEVTERTVSIDELMADPDEDGDAPNDAKPAKKKAAAKKPAAKKKAAPKAKKDDAEEAEASES